MMSLDLVSPGPSWDKLSTRLCPVAPGWHPLGFISRKKSFFIPVIPIWFFELPLFGLAGITRSVWANLCGQDERLWCLAWSESWVHPSSVGEDEGPPKTICTKGIRGGGTSPQMQPLLIVKGGICAGQAKTTDVHYIWPQQNKILVCHKECSFHINIFVSRDKNISTTVSSIVNSSITRCYFMGCFGVLTRIEEHNQDVKL